MKSIYKLIVSKLFVIKYLYNNITFVITWHESKRVFVSCDFEKKEVGEREK